MEYSETEYDAMIGRLFSRFPSFQKIGGKAYKPGIDNMLFFDQLTGHPHRKYVTLHIAGTNGKGSVSNMLASVLAASGLRTGLYTSPHILDFRERMRIIDGKTGKQTVEYIGKEEVWDFVEHWNSTFGHLDLSFFEITTMMAFDWFASRNVDVAVIETGLGGRLDSTNIISPAISIITNIGLDHCAMLGNTEAEIAFEKAGIIKPETPVVIGESSPDTDPVFERKVLYTNLQDPMYMGDRQKIMSLLTFAGKTEPSMWQKKDRILADMDLQGSYQEKNLRTVLSAVDVLCRHHPASAGDIFSSLSRMMQDDSGEDAVADAIVHTAGRMDFHGRWERLSSDPVTIADIGHNAHGLRYNFAQLQKYLDDGTCTDLIIVYGAASDKDVEAIFPLMPDKAEYIFTQAEGSRAMPAGELMERYLTFCHSSGRQPCRTECLESVEKAVRRAVARAGEITASHGGAKPLVYIGGSTYVVAEAVSSVKDKVPGC